jgi:hypothetical protein
MTVINIGGVKVLGFVRHPDHEPEPVTVHPIPHTHEDHHGKHPDGKPVRIIRIKRPKKH